MAIGSIIGGIAGGIGSIIGGNAQKKAANKAADVSLQVAQENNALAKDIYSQNKGVLSPYVSRGNQAGDMINALLGLQPTQAPNSTPSTPVGGTAGNVLGNSGGDAWTQAMRRIIQARNGGGISEREAFWDEMQRRGIGGGLNQSNHLQSVQPAAPPAPNPQQAFDIFRNSTGYQFRLGQGMDAINSGYAANGLLQSGAAQKALQRYGQDYASNEFGNYLGYLSNQQGVGLSGASALAGVGQNYVNNVSSNNNSAGSAAANAAIAKGNATANMWGGIANGIGNIFGSSYGGF